MKLRQGKILASIFFLSIIFVSMNFCQSINKKSNTLYLEIGGNNVFYSINYEKELIKNLSARIGISIIPITEYSNSGKHNNSNLFVTLMPTYFINIKGNHFLELGGGISYGLETFFPAIAIGYRYIPDVDGIIFKLTFTPLLDKDIFDVFPWFGLGVGIKF